MYAGVLEDILKRNQDMNTQIAQTNKNNMATANANQYKTKMGDQQDSMLYSLLNPNDANYNPSQYDYMMKQKMVQNNQQPSFADRIKGIFGGN